MYKRQPYYDPVFDWTMVEKMADVLVEGGRRFSNAVLAGLADRGVQIDDPAALLLAIRRMGPKRMEALFGPGVATERGRTPLIHAEWARELSHMAEKWVSGQTPLSTGKTLSICIGTTDVHEHGKYLVERAFEGLGIVPVDAGVAVDPDALVARALASGADAIAISTYNGVALTYATAVKAEMEKRGVSMPVLIGGRLNEVPKDSNSGLPVDATKKIAALGLAPCADLDEMLAVLRQNFSGDGG